MATNGTPRLGTPVKPANPTVSTEPNRTVPPPPNTAPPAFPPPPPLIPTSLLQANEQRLLFVSLFGLVEVYKVWDILAPYVTTPDPTWSNAIRLTTPLSAAAWSAAELALILSVALLRIPQLSPSISVGNIVKLALGLIVWNAACLVVSSPGAVFQALRIDLIGPPSLGGASLWSIVSALGPREKPHLGGKHQIRLLPYSTATLNPLSLSYCIPPDSANPQPLYIPIVFNNSVPDQITYFVRSLETGETDTRTVAASSLRRSTQNLKQLQITDEEDASTDDSETDPLSALVLHAGQKQTSGQVAKLPSVKPADSLALVPQHLASSQTMLFLTIDSPSLVSLKSVVDKRGDRFQITPHKDAVIIECPTGGHFMDGTMIKKADKIQPAELRCVGDEEVAEFQARGVGSLKVGWTKTSASAKDAKSSGLIEGIEDEPGSVDTLGLVRRDKVSKTHTVPLRLAHDRPGIYTIALTSVTDSLHNTYTPGGHSAQKVYQVIPKSTVNMQCASPLQLLVNGTASIPITINGNNNGNPHSPMDVVYTFRSTQGEVSTHSMRLSKKSEVLTVTEPGVYTLQEMTGQCSGGVMEPSSCRVQLIAPPAVDMTVTTLNEGAMDIGVNAVFEFTGTPPFRVHWTEQRKGSNIVEQSRKFDAHHGEVILQPEHEGQYTYTFTGVSDRHYKGIKLDQPPIQQTVHPLANIDIPGLRDGLSRRKLYSCSGDVVDIDLEAKGNPPLSLNYLLSYGSHFDNKTIEVPSGRSKISVDVPKELNSESGASGRMSITLLSIRDGDGRVRKLPAPTVEVDIHRQKPSVRFAKSDRAVITEGESSRAPLRLTGDAPWEVQYSLNGGKAKKVSLRDANNHLTLQEAGVYRLVSVKDAHCPGLVTATDDTFEIAFKPRPKVELVPSGSLTLQDKVYRHKGFCTGGEDQVALHFDGQAPYELAYRYTTSGHTGKHTLKSAQETGILHLRTEPGYHRYDFSELRDSNYANNPVQLSLEHDVYSRPSASFIKTNTKPLCLDQTLKSDAKIRLEGKAPFTINLAVRRPASSKVETHAITTDSNEWKLELPQTMTEIGRYEISIVSISDISDCEQIVHDSDKLVTTVEVVESARIVPVTQTQDLCVGDNLDFLLQGKAPWSIEYEWLKKRHTVTSSASRFSRYAEAPGNFSILSVALKDNQCKRDVNDLLRIVHPLPSVRIQEGLVHLREGDDPASFSVKFTGTPPFTFTYTRSQLVGSRTKILDTQTVTDIMEYDYTISSSLEGDYEVTSVADRWCRYPPLTKGRNEV